MQLKINYTQPEFQSMLVNDKFEYMLHNKQHLVVEFCHQAYSKRRQTLCNQYLESAVFSSDFILHSFKVTNQPYVS